MSALVSIICCTMRPTFMTNIFQNYDRQKFRKKEMIIILNRDDMDIRKWRRRARKSKNVRVYRVSEKLLLGKCLNFGIRKAKYNILAKFDDDDYYSPYYLQEMVRALKRSRASIIGKHTSYLYFEAKKALMLYRKGGERSYQNKVKGGTLVFRRSLWDKVKFNENRTYGTDVRFLSDCRKQGYRSYSVSRYNYVCVRRADTRTHTQKTATRRYMAKCRMLRRTSNYARYVHRRL